MPNLNKLILTGADYKIFLALSTGVTYPLLTVDSINLDIAVEEELIYAVGEEDAIGNKQNSRKFTGKLSMQVGEISAILLLNGLTDATRITNATLACTAAVGGFQRTLRSANINTETIDIKRKDKESLVSMNMTAITNI